jgi:hypothetical protein
MNTDAHMIVTSMVKDLANSYDEQIMAFFGSEELAKEYMHMFVIEQLPIGMSIVPGGDDQNQFIFHAETEIRIRPKTLAELEAEK